MGRKPGLIKFYMTVILHFEPDSFSKKRVHVEDQTPDFLTKREHLSMTPQILLLMSLLPFYLNEDFIFSSSSACQLLILFLFLILPFLLMERSGFNWTSSLKAIAARTIFHLLSTPNRQSYAHMLIYLE